MIKTFLIGDLRGYTRFTDQRGDEAAARLSQRFVALATEAFSNASGELLEVRGDEVLAVFDSPRDAVRAAIALQVAVTAENERNPDFPLRAGIGIDVGEATPVDGGFRGRALNMAARLCSRARPGEILVTPELAHLAGAVEGLAFEERGSVRLKGLSRPVQLHAVVALARGEAPPRVAEAAGLEIRVLGPLDVLHEGRTVPLGGHGQRLVLAHLLAEPNHVVSMDDLIRRLWGEEVPNGARTKIQSYISNLRAALGPERIEGKPPGYVLHAEPGEIDLLRFERLIRRAHRQLAVDPHQAVESFDEALSLWHGPPFADLGSTESLVAEVARLEELRLAAMEDRVAGLLELGEYREVVADLQTLTGRHPLRERLWGHLMIALYRSGRQADALTAFERARDILSNERGIAPSRELQELHERMLKQDPGLESSGRPLRSYRLLEEIGEGAFGVVWRAADPGTGREVAIKQIRPQQAEDPAFVRGFEREAQIIARLEHPRVVPLYDYWRDGGGAYLVMRLMRGGSLADAMEAGRLSLDEAARVVGHVADALSWAHRQGLIHRDIRPENILLDEDGNAYLSDFGIAKEATEGSPNPTPSSGDGYLSPEQTRGEAPTPRSDIYALGRLLQDIVGDRPDLPSAAREVIARATAADPLDRYDDALALAQSFLAAIGTQQTRTLASPGEDLRNPYKGLRPFAEADAADFFGRDSQIDRLVARVKDERFLAVVGPSGSGKSSVVRAGLIPALRGGALAGSERWFYAEMRPGPRPLEELEAALLRIAPNPPASLLEDLERDEHGLGRAAGRVLPDDGTELLLLIDQFEEVFTLVEDEGERSEFLEILSTAASDPGSRIRVVLTLRADHYDRPLSYPGLAELVRAHSEVVVPLSPEELERAIAGPAERVGVVPERVLVAEVVADVTDQPGALPLLQFALTETFDRRSDGVLTLEAYRDTGGVTGALARRAEQLYSRMNEQGREAARQLFLRLVSVGEGAEDTRRLVLRAELASLEVDPVAMDAVIDSFGRHRLLSFDRDPDTRGPTVEVAHEALLREWTRLRGWIDASREDVIMHRRLGGEADEWERSGRDPSFLLRGSRLAQLEGWAEATGLALSGAERAFLRESVSAREGERAAEQDRLDRERALERRSVVRLRALVGALTAAALVASGLTVIAAGQRGRARREARTATARELAAAADANLSVDPERSILLALQAVATTGQDGAVLPEAEQALHNAVEASRLAFTIRDPSTANVEYSPDGRLIATGGTAGGLAQDAVLLWDARTGGLVRRLSGHTGDVGSVVFNADGSRLVTTADDNRTIIWDTETGERLLTLPGAPGNAFGASFSPDGKRIAIGANNEHPIRIVDAVNGKELRTIHEEGLGFSGPEFSPDGSRIAAGGWEGTSDAAVWDVATGKRVLTLRDGGGSAVYNPDGSRILTNSGEVWDARTGRRLFRLQGGDILGTAWSADGSMLATGSSDGTARIWDAADGQQLLVLAGHAGLVAMVDFSPDGTRLLTGGGDGTARVWDITRAGGAEAFTSAEPDSLSAVAYSADGSTLLTTGFFRAGAFVWDAATGRKLRSYGSLFGSGAFVPGERTIVGLGCYSICPGFTAIDASTGTVLNAFAPPGWDFGNSAFSPDGQLLATAQEDGSVALWDVSSGRRLRNMGTPASLPGVNTEDVAFSPNGKLLAAIDTHAMVAVWDVSTARRLLKFQAHRGLAHAVAFSSDGKLLATSAGDGAAVWNASIGTRIGAFTGSGSVNDVAFSHDGKRLATAGDNGTVGIWDVASGRLTLTLGEKGEGISAITFSPDGTRLAAAGGDGRLRVFLLRVDDLIRVARARLTRGFTEAECRQYLHVSTCPASLRSAEPPAASGTSTPPLHNGPEGAFRVSIGRPDFPSGVFSPEDLDNKVGDYTLSFVRGEFRLFQALPSGDTWFTSGTYKAEGDRITITDTFESGCFGWSVSARWSLQGMTLVFANTSSTVVSTCLQPPQNDAWAAAVFGSRPWTRVAHHEKGG